MEDGRPRPSSFETLGGTKSDVKPFNISILKSAIGDCRPESPATERDILRDEWNSIARNT